MKTVFSVIIPVYNMEQHLERCLDSIVAQDYTELEVILINDGSTDSSGEICDRYAQNDSRFQVIHQNNGGVSSARNSGLDKATGDYISFIDPDDWIESGMYETLNKYLQNKDIDILRFNAYRQGEIVNQLPFKGEYSAEKLEKEVMLPLIGSPTFGGMFILGVLWLHLYRREIIEKYHIRFNTDLRRCEDRLFTLTAVLHSRKMFFTDYTPYHYEVYDDSLSNKYDSLRWEQELIYLDELKKEYSECKPAEFLEDANQRIYSEYLLRAITSVNNEFFSKNNSNFRRKYLNTRKIIGNPFVRESIKKTKKEKSSLKGTITWVLIQYNLPLLLSIFNTIIVYKNKILPNG